MSGKVKTAVWVLVVIITFIVIYGSVTYSNKADQREREALRTYREEADPSKRIEGLRVFLKDHPKGTFRGYAHYYIFATYLNDLADTAAALSYAREILSSEELPDTKGPLYESLFGFWHEMGQPESVLAIGKEVLELPITDASVYNGMGYLLALSDVHLQLAIELAERAVELAKDDFTKSYSYDTLGWALFKAGRLDDAVQALKESRKLSGGEPDETVLRHLAEAQLRANDMSEAIDTYLELMAVGQFDDVKSVLDSLYVVVKGSSQTLEADIESRRAARMTPAPEFVLGDLEGRSVSLAGMKGKVVLLNFMSPT